MILFADDAGKAVALYILHHEIEHSARFAEVRNFYGVGVVDHCSCAGLAQEAFDHIIAHSHLRMNYFYSDVVADKGVSGAKNRSHSAQTQKGLHLVFAVDRLSDEIVEFKIA